jgi:asparagine synthase (glutamine-hydrolysing)
MSAIIGVISFNDRPLNKEVPNRMLASLAHRGSDAQGIWCHGGVGLGHGMLWTTPESLHEKQPLGSQDGNLKLVSDARIDNREELIGALELKNGPMQN